MQLTIPPLAARFRHVALALVVTVAAGASVLVTAAPAHAITGFSAQRFHRVGADGAYTKDQIHPLAGETVHVRTVVKLGTYGDEQLNLTFRDDSCGEAGHAIGNVAPGSTVNFDCTYVATIGEPATRRSIVTGTGTVSGHTQSSGSNTTSVHVHDAALELRFEQAGATGMPREQDLKVRVGDPIRYEVTVSNTGAEPLDVTPSVVGCSDLDTEPLRVEPDTDQVWLCRQVQVAPGTQLAKASVVGHGTHGIVVRPAPKSLTARVLRNELQVSATVVDAAGTPVAAPLVYTGDTLRYAIDVTNVGTGMVTYDLSAAGCGGAWTDLELAGGDSARVTCERTVTAADGTAVSLEVRADGSDELGLPVTGTTTRSTTIQRPALRVDQQVRLLGVAGSTFGTRLTVRDGDVLELRMVVSNTGNTPLTVTVDNDTCAVWGATTPFGLDRTNVALAAGATATYTCMKRVDSDAPIAATAAVVATDPNGRTVRDSDRVDVLVVSGGVVVTRDVRIAGSGADFLEHAVAAIGDTVEVRLTVRNLSNTTMTVTIEDARCAPFSAGLGRSGVADELAPGELVVYGCSFRIGAGNALPVTHTARVSGVDPTGETTVATSTSRLDAAPMAATPDDALPGETAGPRPVGIARPRAISRLARPRRCIGRLLPVLVTGRNIRIVQVYVNGRWRTTIRRNVRQGRWVTYVNARGLRAGRTHRLLVRVHYRSVTRQRPQLRGVVFRSCGVRR